MAGSDWNRLRLPELELRGIAESSAAIALRFRSRAQRRSHDLKVGRCEGVAMQHHQLSTSTTISPVKPGPMPIALDGTDGVPADSTITVTGLPQGAMLSKGRSFGDTGWKLERDEIGDLQLVLSGGSAGGQTKLTIELVAPTLQSWPMPRSSCRS